MNIEFLDEEMTRAQVTTEAKTSRWWRRRYVTAEVRQESPPDGHRGWRFVLGGDRVYDHDAELASELESKLREAREWRQYHAERAKLKNPWREKAPIPPARTVRR